jgi:hypothetical protein
LPRAPRSRDHRERRDRLGAPRRRRQSGGDEAHAAPVGCEGEHAQQRLQLGERVGVEIDHHGVRLGRVEAEQARLELARAAVIVHQAVDEVERDEPAAAATRACARNPAAEPAHVKTRRLDRALVAG